MAFSLERANSLHESSVVRQVRILALLDGARQAGIAPLSAKRMHQLAYLTNALAPVWNLEPLTPELLKLYGSPYDATLQSDVDRLVVIGLIRAQGVSYDQDDRGSWRVSASYSIQASMAQRLLHEIEFFPDEKAAAGIAKEICLALSALPEDVVDLALGMDASYSNNQTSANSLVSLFDNQGSNPSARSAALFESLGPSNSTFGPSEQVNLYLRHLYRMATQNAS